MNSDPKMQEAISKMKACPLGKDQELLRKLYEYGDITGKLSKPDILRIWNGARLDRFSVKTLRSLFEFLSFEFGLGHPALYFGEEGQTSVPASVLPQPFDRKEQYLATLAGGPSKTYDANVLKRVSRKVERLFNKDLCEMSADQLTAGMSDMEYTSQRTVRAELDAVKRYIEWCWQNGYFTPDHANIERIRPKEIAVKRGLWLALTPSPDALQEIIYTTKSKDEVNTDSVILCLFWLGLTLDELYNLKSRNVNLLEKKIQNDYFGEILIPDELIDIFRNYQQNDVVQSAHLTFYADKTEFFLSRFVHERNLAGARLTIESIPVTINRFKRKYCESIGREFKISGTNMFTSGACWRLYKRECGGEELTDGVVGYEARTSTPTDIVNFKKTYGIYKELFYNA